MCETHGHGEDHAGRLLVTDRYKYVANRGQLDELYDLEKDPYELTNLVSDPGYRDVLSDMQARLVRWQRTTGDPETWLIEELEQKKKG
jgi:arylsulfatase A-like enzyme